MADKTRKRLPQDFNVKTPPLAVTDPDAQEKSEAGEPIDREYPKHLVAFEDGPGTERVVQEVKNAVEERHYRAHGFGTHHDLDAQERKAGTAKKTVPPPPAPGAKAPAKRKRASKPRNPKPKTPKPETSVQ